MVEAPGRYPGRGGLEGSMSQKYTLALSPSELTELTGYKIVKKQISALGYMRIPFKLRPNGTPFVAKAVIVDNTEKSAPPPPKATVRPL